MIYMGGARHGSIVSLLVALRFMNIWLGGPRVLQFVFGGRSITPFMDHGNMFPLMFKRLVMQAFQLPRK